VLDGRCDGHRDWQERNARARDVFRKRRREVTEAESSNEFVLDASRQRRSAVRGGRDVGTEKSAAELRCWMDAAMRTANGRKETQERVASFGSDDVKSRKPRTVTSLSWTRRGRGRTALHNATNLPSQMVVAGPPSSPSIHQPKRCMVSNAPSLRRTG
jgi:hypothetical protein